MMLTNSGLPFLGPRSFSVARDSVRRWGTHDPKWLMDAGTVMVMGMPTAPPMVLLQRLQLTWVQKLS